MQCGVMWAPGVWVKKALKFEAQTKNGPKLKLVWAIDALAGE